MYINKENNSLFIIQKLNQLKNDLNKDQVNVGTIQRDIEAVNQYKDIEKCGYLSSLLDPKNKIGAKIPSDKPFPSCTFQLHEFYTFKPTSTGKILFAINPWFLYTEEAADEVRFRVGGGGGIECKFGNYALPFFICQNPLMGSKDVGPHQWNIYDKLNLGIGNIYDKYRLVSACMEIRYIGDIDEASGTIGGGISFEKGNYIGTRINRASDGSIIGYAVNPNYFKYSNFELIRDLPYFQEFNCLEGIRMLYFPLDNDFNQFRKVCDFKGMIYKYNDYPLTHNSYYTLQMPDDSKMKSGFNWIAYIMGAPVPYRVNNFRIDWYFNYECLPKAELLNYIPISIDVYEIPQGLLKKIIEEVQEKAVQKLNK